MKRTTLVIVAILAFDCTASWSLKPKVERVSSCRASGAFAELSYQLPGPRFTLLRSSGEDATNRLAVASRERGS